MRRTALAGRAGPVRPCAALTNRHSTTALARTSHNAIPSRLRAVAFWHRSTASQPATVTVRPFRSDELEAVWEARKLRASPTSPITPGAKRAIQRQIERSGRLYDGFLKLAIDVDGRLVGEIDARCPANAFPPGVFEVGIELYDDGDRGRGYGAEAVRQLVDRLFAREGAERVQASTAADNTAMRRVLEKLGFAYEGTLRAFMPADDGRDDYVMYAVTRPEWATPR